VPNQFFSHFHDRMVGQLTPELAKRWLDPTAHSKEDLLECVRAPGENELAGFRVKGDIAKRKSGDWSAVETEGAPLTIADVTAPKKGAKAGGKQATL
jgi:putative SOS response-associated peptidase YedK